MRNFKKVAMIGMALMMSATAFVGCDGGNTSGGGTRGFLYAIRGAKRDATTDKDESEYLRSSIGLRRYSIPSASQSDDARIVAWYD